jgi:AAA family ATP:ADP antiporter
MKARMASPTLPSKMRATAIGAFFTLAGIMAAHTLLETARDALFLSALPASHLAWVYLGIAALAVGVTQAQQHITDRWDGPYLLSFMLLGAAGITTAFWSLSSGGGAVTFYLLYIWGSVFATVVTVHFWLVVGRAYTFTEAKRGYAFIGAGGGVGAIAGAAGARALTHAFDARHLLMASAVAMVLAAFGPVAALRRSLRGEHPRRRRRYTLRENLPLLRDDPYLRRVVGVVLVSTVTFTLVDYIFKSEVKAAIPPERLGSFFATVNIVFNGVSLAAQLLVVPWLIHRTGVTRAVLLLPLLLLGSGVAVALTGGLAAVLAMKAADGGMRYSLHRTTTELLYVPISDSLRDRVKGLMDGLGQRGGQALGSVVIIGCIAVHDARVVLGGLLGALALGWLLVGLGLRAHYLDLFRTALKTGARARSLELPALDMRSLETFITALSSDDDAEVMAALDLLADQGRARLIPALILYHPSAPVVLRALEVFAAADRKDFAAPLGRLLRHREPEIRAAALDAYCTLADSTAAPARRGRRTTPRPALAPTTDLLRRALQDESPLVSTTALVHLVADGTMPPDEAHAAFDRIVREGTPEERQALVRAIRRSPLPVFEEVLLGLAGSDIGATSVELPEAMAEIKSEAFLAPLTAMLANRELVSSARAALVAIGPPALAWLDQAMTDPEVPAKVRRHVPRTIARFDPWEAIPILLKHLPRAPDGMVRYKILRGLNRLAVEAPEAPMDPEVLTEVTQQTAEEALRALDWRVQLETGATADARRRTPSLELLLALLRDKEQLAIERLFRLLGLRFVGEDFARIWRGLRSGDEHARASSRELLENLLQAPLREVVLSLVGEEPDGERLARVSSFYPGEPLDYEALLGKILASRSESLRSLAAYYVGEAGLATMRPALVASIPTHDQALAGVVSRALEMLDGATARAATAGAAHAG